MPSCWCNTLYEDYVELRNVNRDTFIICFKENLISRIALDLLRFDLVNFSKSWPRRVVDMRRDVNIGRFCNYVYYIVNIYY